MSIFSILVLLSRDKCKDTLKIIARMKKELEEINDLKEDRKES